jgi:hypothetical protein
VFALALNGFAGCAPGPGTASRKLRAHETASFRLTARRSERIRALPSSGAISTAETMAFLTPSMS